MRSTLRTVAVAPLLAAAAVAVALAAPSRSPERVVAALLLVLALPGVPGSRLLRPSRGDAERDGSWPAGAFERLLLIPALSIALVILDSVALYVAGVKLDLDSWTLSLAAITVALGIVELLPFARPRHAEAGRRAVRGVSRPAREHAAGCACARRFTCGRARHGDAGGRGSAHIRQRHQPRHADHFTQLWLLPSAGGHRSSAIGVFNHQGSHGSYRLRVFANGVRSAHSCDVGNGATWRGRNRIRHTPRRCVWRFADAGGAPQVTMLHIYPPPPRPRPHVLCAAFAAARGRCT